VTVGRLVPSKRVDDLITGFAMVADRFPAWTLTIVGDGSVRQSLEDLAAARGVRDRVSFCGFRSEPWRLLAEASVFVLSSAHEGFPNVLVEAAASGCAIVSSDCLYGPGEILDEGRQGLLYPVGDVARLAECLTQLMENDGTRLGFAERAHQGVSRYRAGAEDPWVDLLVTLAGRSPMRQSQGQRVRASVTDRDR
jgi:glycosyltransferase involved in cell wall biosynthesis